VGETLVWRVKCRADRLTVESEAIPFAWTGMLDGYDKPLESWSVVIAGVSTDTP
jgi:hypothetical protein